MVNDIGMVSFEMGSLVSLNIFYFNQYEKGSGKKFYQHYIKPSPLKELVVSYVN